MLWFICTCALVRCTRIVNTCTYTHVIPSVFMGIICHVLCVFLLTRWIFKQSFMNYDLKYFQSCKGIACFLSYIPHSALILLFWWLVTLLSGHYFYESCMEHSAKFTMMLQLAQTWGFIIRSRKKCCDFHSVLPMMVCYIWLLVRSKFMSSVIFLHLFILEWAILPSLSNL